MTNIISVGTAVPPHKHLQQDILDYMIDAFGLDATEARKLSFLYRHSDIQYRHSVLPDFSRDSVPEIFSKDADVPAMECRMKMYDKHALQLSAEALQQAIHGVVQARDITHLITVSCTGMSAPGLDLQLLSAMQMHPTVFRTSVNFMGCYGAIHGLKLASFILATQPTAVVAVVATEICTIHFQHDYTADNAGSSLLFGDGSAAILLSNRKDLPAKACIRSFYSRVAEAGRDDMSWHLSSHGFLMKLSAYIPKLIEADIESLVNGALEQSDLTVQEITHWCVHPGGKKILDNISGKLNLKEDKMQSSRQVLRDYGNMSSPTVLFVLKELLEKNEGKPGPLLGMAFGPGLTMETFCGELL